MAKEKISAKAKIKEVTLKPSELGSGFISVKFDGLEFSRSQEKEITEWMDGKEELLVTLEPNQPRFKDT